MKYRVFFLFLRFDFFVSRIEDTVCIFHMNCENIDDVLVTDMSANNIRTSSTLNLTFYNTKNNIFWEVNALYLCVSLINGCHINLNIFDYSPDPLI